jgi:hypothetical protein
MGSQKKKKGSCKFVTQTYFLSSNICTIPKSNSRKLLLLVFHASVKRLITCSLLIAISRRKLIVFCLYFVHDTGLTGGGPPSHHAVGLTSVATSWGSFVLLFYVGHVCVVAPAVSFSRL